QKGHVTVQGMEIAIENPKGSQRKGVSPEGKKWSIEMKHHYGYFNRTEGKDGDQVDTFVGPDTESPNVYIVDQVEPGTGKFDEHKVMTGFSSEEAAKEGYLANYEKGWQGLENITEMSIEKFKNWLTWESKKPAATITKDVVVQPKPVETTEKKQAQEAEKKKIVQPAASENVKEPWEMTLSEYESISGKPRKGATSYSENTFHKNAVHTAINQGKAVPESVLKDYPDLKKTQPAAPKTEKVAEKAPHEAYAPKKREQLTITPEHGRGLKYESEVQIAETGEVVKVKEDAGQALEDIDERILSLKILRDCI
ncbi:hypothetical protein KAR91_53875, partial [Candidatus Pacearchaeota archaeon]|nr:hypothetical protein [Candidatus Pacearchaeota archaeon]